MTKSTVTRLFIGGAVAVLAGSVLATGAVWVAILNDAFVMNGADIVGIRGSAVTWVTLGLGLVGGTAVASGFVAGLVSWIGALLNTAQLENRAWYVALLLLGVFSLGVVAMIAYVVAGPDGSAVSTDRSARLPAAPTPA